MQIDHMKNVKKRITTWDEKLAKRGIASWHQMEQALKLI